ncbi:MAG: GDP-mannose 4,6-dehydratase [Kineosporiaceae bacterium]
MSTRALVTGVTGQDGSYLAEALAARGWEVHGLVRDAAAGVADAVRVHVGDLADVALFDRLLPEVRPDVVFHLAGMSSVARSWREPGRCLEVVAAATARLLEAAARDGSPPRVVLAGSSEVFGAAGSSPQSEATPLAPASPYGAAKAAVVMLGRVYRATGRHVSTALLYNHESPRRAPSFVTRKITSGVAAVVTGRSRELRLGNLAAVRDWGWAPDYVQAMVAMADAAEPDDFVVATGEAHSVEDFVAAAFRAVGIADWRRFVVVDPGLFRPVEGTALVGDSSRLRTRLGWRPTVGFDEVVARMVRADVALAGR